ncbi:hypothetical protein [Streptomyces sp. NRRL S-920]|uniref:hypothetical protein n=1 Tax=Streptomyces sp. NRRL S-920 TaxID=1463921 RepID=UPI000998B2DB|nr:hypothetical protein [Streptomyces sp. NRRL S-920]
MRDSISRALLWVLRLLLPARGKRRAVAVLTPEPTTPPRVICGPTTPIPAHVLTRSIPSPWYHRIGPWLLAREAEREGERTLELRVIRERRRAAVLAAEGVDYPYTYEGAPFPRSAFAAAGVSA